MTGDIEQSGLILSSDTLGIQYFDFQMGNFAVIANRYLNILQNQYTKTNSTFGPGKNTVSIH